MLREFVELGRCRLDRGWTYRRTVDEINRYAESKGSEFRISIGRLHGLLNDPKVSPNEMTLHTIRGFLESLHRARKAS
jgi:hypothetical protein